VRRQPPLRGTCAKLRRTLRVDTPLILSGVRSVIAPRISTFGLRLRRCRHPWRLASQVETRTPPGTARCCASENGPTVQGHGTPLRTTRRTLAAACRVEAASAFELGRGTALKATAIPPTLTTMASTGCSQLATGPQGLARDRSCPPSRRRLCAVCPPPAPAQAPPPPPSRGLPPSLQCQTQLAVMRVPAAFRPCPPAQPGAPVATS
jgi:hypothetical protein